MTDWITDRPPTEADGDIDGDVILQDWRMGRGPSALAHWSKVQAGTAWKRIPMRPAKPAPEPAPAEPARELTLSDFKVGQVWRTRGGMTCTIKEINPPSLFKHPILSDLYGDHYHFPNGQTCLGNEAREDDLIELISEAPQPVPAEPARELELSDFKVGQVWRTRDGQTVVISSTPGPNFVFPISAYPSRAKSCFFYYYTSRGKFRPDNVQTNFDLVELISEAPEFSPEPPAVDAELQKTAAAAPEPDPAPAPQTRMVPRLFAAPIQRFTEDHNVAIEYALADDGTAWVRVLGSGESASWQRVPSLPDREEPIDAA